MDYSKEIARLAALFREMVANYNSAGDLWKNIPLAAEAFDIMKNRLPEVLEGEYSTPAERASLLENMLEVYNELDTPRFCIGVREFIHSIAPGNANSAELKRLSDYVNPDIDTEAWRKTYGRHLRFDPVERSPRWEEVIYDVEKECAHRLRSVPRGMGFCFEYWSVKREVLARMGIEWRSPRAMNPRVMFD